MENIEWLGRKVNNKWVGKNLIKKIGLIFLIIVLLVRRLEFYWLVREGWNGHCGCIKYEDKLIIEYYSQTAFTLYYFIAAFFWYVFGSEPTWICTRLTGESEVVDLLFVEIIGTRSFKLSSSKIKFKEFSFIKIILIHLLIL